MFTQERRSKVPLDAFLLYHHSILFLNECCMGLGLLICHQVWRKKSPSSLPTSLLMWKKYKLTSWLLRAQWWAMLSQRNHLANSMYGWRPLTKRWVPRWSSLLRMCLRRHTAMSLWLLAASSRTAAHVSSLCWKISQQNRYTMHSCAGHSSGGMLVDHIGNYDRKYKCFQLQSHVPPSNNVILPASTSKLVRRLLPAASNNYARTGLLVFG